MFLVYIPLELSLEQTRLLNELPLGANEPVQFGVLSLFVREV